jgi:tetratricopeptide (TPR) repeat protein
VCARAHISFVATPVGNWYRFSVMLRGTTALALGAALLLCGCGKSAAAKLEQARDLALAGHHNAALIEARAVLFQLGDDRGDGADDVRRGALKLSGDLCALHLDKPRCAAQEYRQLVKRYPTAPESFEARERLGDLDLRLGDVRGALEAWRDQVAAAPDRPGADVAQLKIARAQTDRGDYQEARAASAELQKRWPESKLASAAALLSASTYHLSGRHADAVEAYRGVTQQYAGSKQAAEARFEMGNCLVEMGDDAHAVQAFTQALPTHDSPDVVQFALERAQRRLDMAKAVDPRNLSAVFDRGLARNGRASTH